METHLNRNVFDRVARDYESIHNRSLPPGVQSADFIDQRAEKVTRWILNGYTGQEFCYLDFGCGNGRMLKCLLASGPLQRLLKQGRLRLFGFDTSIASIHAAQSLVGDASVRLVSDWQELPAEIRFDFVISCHVFHHIPPAERATVANTLHRRMKPASKLVIWEHNPFNPMARLLVEICPFDADARLLTLKTTRAVFDKKLYNPIQHAYVNFFPPSWLRLHGLAALEHKLMRLPLGAQYWALFERLGARAEN
jgi:SAM-dependent methyltransferase